jgi:hypothetical protein
MLPNFLIIGAEKAGTTWLYEKLRRHPEVYMPRVKELCFFSRDGSDGKTREWYEKHFEAAPAVGEATPAYMYGQRVPRRIADTIPDVKLIACLRHPTDRTYSHYWMNRGLGEVDCTFDEVVRERREPYIGNGRYGEQLDRYLSHFDRDQLLILISEEVFSDQSASLNHICSFLGVDDAFYQDQEWIASRENRAARTRSKFALEVMQVIATWMRHTEGVRQVLDALKTTGLTDLIKDANREPREYPGMDPEVRKALDEYYASTVLRVEEILGREIKAWRDKMVLEV